MVVNTEGTGRNQANPNMADVSAGNFQGWYFYGITTRQPLAAVLADAPDDSDFGWESVGSAEDAPLQLLEFSGVVAVVRAVRLADFAPAVVEERLRSAAQLEAMVRNHHRVIEAIHGLQPILPAKFGMVFPHARDILLALRSAHEPVKRQLERLTACDEWAVHVYADPAVVRKRVAAGDTRISRLRQEFAEARPGRLWFLERQLRDQMTTATQDALATLAQKNFDRLTARAVAGEITSIARDATASEEVEILSATFLVRRDALEQFMEQVDACNDATEGVRCESTGPWPPYSFADPGAEVAV
jgi:hypothetical protein